MKISYKDIGFEKALLRKPKKYHPQKDQTFFLKHF